MKIENFKLTCKILEHLHALVTSSEIDTLQENGILVFLSIKTHIQRREIRKIYNKLYAVS